MQGEGEKHYVNSRKQTALSSDQLKKIHTRGSINNCNDDSYLP